MWLCWRLSWMNIGVYLSLLRSRSFSMISSILSAASLLTLTAISVDRLLALFLGLKSIQTRCNTETCLLDHYYLLHCVYCFCNNQALLEFPYSVMVWHFMCFIVICSLDLLLYEDFLHPSSSSTSSTRPYSATEPNKSTEHCAIQKGSVQCSVVASNLSRLLSIIFIIDNLCYSCWVIFVCFFRLELPLLYLSSSLNPILYYWKLNEVRQAVKDTIRQVLCCWSS